MEQKLTNIIIAKSAEMASGAPGLFTGEMGPCLALYLLNKKYCIPRAENAADNMMSQIYEHTSKFRNINFDSGLSGIGYGINMLSENNCIEGNIDDILHDIDAILYRELTSYRFQYSKVYTSGLTGIGLYFASRIENANHDSLTIHNRLIEAALRIIIEKLYDTAPSVLCNISKDLYTCALWDVQLIFFLVAKAFEVNVYRNKILAMVRTWLLYLNGNHPYFNINKLGLALSLTYLSRRICNPDDLSKQIDFLFNITDFDAIPNEVEYNITNINEGWLYVLLLLEKAKNDLSKSHPQYSSIEKCKKRIVEECQLMNIHILKEENTDITFIGGMSGIAVIYSIFPELFEGIESLF